MKTVNPKKKFGQNFLNDNSTAVQIVGFLSTEKTNNIIEVGPGMGILTKEILKIDNLNKKFIELDKECCDYLLNNFSKIKKDLIFTYISAQILGCLLGVMLANFMFDLPFIELSSKARPGFNIFIAEVIATFGLIFIIFGSLKNGTVAVAASVATYITAGYWFTSSTSFANPAVALARTFTDTFTGINYLNTPTYIVAEIIGALLALFIIQKILFKK